MTTAFPARATDPTPRTAAPAPRTGRPLAGTARVSRLLARSARWSLLMWTVVVTGLVVASAQGVISLYDSAADRAGYAATTGGSAATAAMAGRPHDLDTVGGIAAFEIGFFTMLVFPVIAVHLAIRLTRSHEDAGRIEQVRAAPVGALAPVVAGGIVAAAVAPAVGLLTWIGLTAVGLPAAGAGWYAAGLTGELVFFTALGLLAAQAGRTSRAAHSVALGVFAASTLLRAVIDGRGLDAVWLTPTGWLAEIRPFGSDPRAWPVLALAGAAVVLATAALAVAARRDLGGGLIAERPGPRTGVRALGTPIGLWWRLGRGTFGLWMSVTVGWGLVMGVLASELEAQFAENPAIASFVGADGGPPASLLVWLATVMQALLVAAMAVQVVSQIRDEEAAGRTTLVTTTRVRRGHWVWAGVVVLLARIVAMAVAGALALYAGLRLVGADPSLDARVVDSLLAHLPGVLAIAGLAVLLYAVRPATVGAAWAVVGWSAVVAILAESLSLPEWSRALSPFHLVGRVPVERADGTAVVALLVGTLVASALAGWALSRRDLLC